jgi:hypothetical protein
MWSILPSIYTHSLDWAIEGKAKAKACLKSKTKLHLGTRIDKFVLAGQEVRRAASQSVHTSILLAHVLLGAVDKRLKKEGSPSVPDLWTIMVGIRDSQ